LLKKSKKNGYFYRLGRSETSDGIRVNDENEIDIDNTIDNDKNNNSEGNNSVTRNKCAVPNNSKRIAKHVESLELSALLVESQEGRHFASLRSRLLSIVPRYLAATARATKQATGPVW